MLRVALLALLQALLCHGGFAQVGAPGAVVGSHADEHVSALARRGRFSGGVLLARGGRVLLHKGYGLANHEHGTPNTTETRFRLASVTKEFTATAVMMLQERGRLDVEDSVCEYVPECLPSWRPIKLRHLLNHTSGIPEFYKSFPDVDSLRRTPTTIARVVERARLVAPASAAGEKVSYSSLGYVLLGHVIERASGETYEDFLRKEILGPLRLGHTGLERQPVILKNRASGYTRDRGDRLINAPYYDLSYISAGGGLYSTAGDLYLWNQALHAERLLKRSSLDAMFRPGLENYGYAWEITRRHGRRLIRADGRSFGFSASLAYYPADRVTVIVLSNLETAGADGIADRLAALVFGEKYDSARASVNLHGSGTRFAKGARGGFIPFVSTPIRIKKLRPGDDTDTYCGRCKAERAHHVVALNADGVPATVICRTCGGQHRFHVKSEASATSPRGAARKPAEKARPARDAPTAPPRGYSPKEVYAAGEWVEHPKFGQGKVVQARGGKIEVRFQSGDRVLLHAG